MKLRFIFAGLGVVVLTAYLSTIDHSEMTTHEDNTENHINDLSGEKQLKNSQPKSTKIKQNSGTAKSLTQSKSAPQSRKMDYSDNWCAPYEDLSEDDLNRYKLESREWSLERGMAFLDGSPDKDYLNSEYLVSYKEEDINTLIELGKEGYRMALIALIQRKNIAPEIYYTAAKELVILGDTAMGLQAMVMEQLNSVRFRYAETHVVDKTIKLNLINALALVEIGLQRKDVSALETYLMYSQDKDKFLSGLNPDYVLNEKDMDKIPQSVSDYKKWIEQSRIDKNLSSLQELPRIAYADYNIRLAVTFDEYGELMDSSKILGRWHESYLQKSPCIERLLGIN